MTVLKKKIFSFYKFPEYLSFSFRKIVLMETDLNYNIIIARASIFVIKMKNLLIFLRIC